ncbi:non-ribosomal peptide synthetase/type I polyketide synthase [Burkholderia sp. AU38729]|uniref:non-ribosomal peptide synthetase/type I polyketide synthase n=1 Tax=Burkholderia sp. AU38729 TaxID=2879633 RepID=UPI001CF3E859|nr:non-ribosomal peptide synthetase/type I polyketide synthase [Burkholderia sp. AU38729]MCA8067691.1 amino acid adenylation domain-containing protein [Burkholderia sp. AU38729]
MKQRERVPEEISIVGMACELPGTAHSLDAFRAVVLDGREATGPMPAGRFGADRAATPPQALHGGFLARSPWAFDPAVFSIAPKEAIYMDPQHRLLLETSYHAIEDAGIDPSSLRKQRWGVFVGLSTLDYARRMASSDDYNGFLSRGALGSMAAGRIAYHLGLEGPAFVVDTACSSSLVAVHQALGALAAGECDAAIVAGASLMLTHDYSVDLAQAGMLAADGRCKTFTRHADGFARGEGIGAVVLMRQSDAVRTGKRIYANLLGSAVNSDGRSNGITAPSQAAQRRVIEDALSSAALTPADVSYVETHGTGTDLGDRIELSALADVFGKRMHPLYLGAVKANIGHCEGSAGIASLIKAALCVSARQLAPHCMADDISEDLPLARFQGVIPATATDWQPGDPDGRLIAGVSSFGMSGTNAHVVLGESRAHRAATPAAERRSGASLLFLSARTPASVQALADAYADTIEASPDIDLHALCDAALANRQVWPHASIAVAAGSPAELVERLRARCAAPVPTTRLQRVAMVFTGQGSQYAGMSRSLFDANRRFRALLTEFAGHVDRIVGWSTPLLPRMLATEQVAGATLPLAREQRTSQLSLLVLQCALARFWQELGCRPYAVLGHSVGEYAAAWFAGAFDFDTAARLVLARADAMERACTVSPGKMLSIAAPRQVVEALIDEVNQGLPSAALWLSALNAPESTVVAGSEAAVLAAAEHARRQGLTTLPLDTQGAFHTPLMQAAADEFAAHAARLLAGGVAVARPSVRFVSSVEGWVGSVQMDAAPGSPAYWAEQIVRPVDFAAAAAGLVGDDVDAVLEIGPRPVLCGLVAATARAARRGLACLPSIDRRGADDATFLRAAGHLAEGGALDIRKAMQAFGDARAAGPFVELPTYRFDHTLLQPASWPHTVSRASTRAAPPQPLRDAPVWSGIDFRATLQVDLGTPALDWINQHRIHGRAIVPGAFYLSTGVALAMQAIARARRQGPAGAMIQLDDLTVSRPLAFDDPAATHEVACHVAGPAHDGRYTIVYRLPDDGDAELARVHVASEHAPLPPSSGRFDEQPGEWARPDAFFDEYARRGVQYGPLFQRIAAYQRVSDTEVRCRIAPPDAQPALPLSHSAFIDTCFQSLGVCRGRPESAYAPVALESIRIDPDARWSSALTCRAVLRESSDTMLVGDVLVQDESGRDVATLHGVTCVRLSASAAERHDVHFRVEWVRDGVPALSAGASLSGETWLLLAPADAPAPDRWHEGLAARGAASRLLALPGASHRDGKPIDEPQADGARVRTIVVWAPHAWLSGAASYGAVAAFVRDVRRSIETVSDRQPGQPLQVCLVTETGHAAPDVLGAATMQALAVHLQAELPTLDAAMLEVAVAGDRVVDAILAVRDVKPGITSRRIATPLWRIDDAGLARRETVAGLPEVDGDNALQPRGDGRYLVTGAFGGAGKHLVEHLVDDCGCRNLVLMRRRALTPDDEDHRWVAGLRERSGATIQLLVADLAAAEVDGAWLTAHAGALDGIFHLAGATADRNILDTDAAQLDTVLGAKLRGASVLHDYACGQPSIGFIVYFSSLASLVESPGQISYAIANAGLQRLAAHGASLGLPAIVVDWGPWADTGMLKRVGARAPSRSLRRLQPLAPQAACAALTAAMARIGRGAHLAIYRVVPEAPARSGDTLATRDAAAATIGPASATTTADGAFALLSRLIAAETGHAPHQIARTSTLDELGLDSVGTIRIRSELQGRLGLSLPASLFFDSATLADIHDRLVESMSQATATAQAEAAPVKEGGAPARVPLSYNQFAIWYEQIRHRDSRAYNCAVGWRVAGEGLDLDRLAARWRALLGEHELLRATFDEVEHEPGYVIHSLDETFSRCAIATEDAASGVDVDARIQALLVASPDLATDFATRVNVLRVSPREWYLVVTSNHLVMDAATIFIVGVQLLQAMCGTTAPLVDSDAPYRDFVATQRALDATTLTAARAFFVERIIDGDGVPVSVDLPVDRVRTEQGAKTGGTVRVPVSRRLADQLNAMPGGRRAAVHLATWLLLLARYSNQNRVITGVAFNGRSAQRWRNTVGHFVNVLPLVSEVDENQTVTAAVDRVRRALFELVDYQDVPLALLMRDERLRSASSSAGLFQTYFNYFDASEMVVDVGARCDATPLDITQQEAQFDLSAWVTQRQHDWAIDLKYADAVFDRATVEQIAEHYATLLVALSDPAHAEREVGSITMLPADQLQLLASGRGPVPRDTRDIDPGDTACVHEQFARRAQETPDAVAIEWGERRLTYRELNALADTVADTLHRQGVGSETTVGILMPRFGCPESIIAILAIWKCAAAYVALDLKHPAARTGYMIDTARCAMVLTQRHRLSDDVRQALAERDALGLCDVVLRADHSAIDCDVVQAGRVQHHARLEPNGDYADRGGQLAYVLFTSGSTGNPKGVLVEHLGLTQRLRWMERHFGFSASDRFLQGTVLTFDISVPEFCLPLMTGGVVVLMEETDGPAGHAAVCVRHDVTMMSTVPSLLNLLLEPLTRCPTLRHVISVGEALMQPVVRAWLASGTTTTLNNLYGPTEVTIYATHHACTQVPDGPGASIGLACDGVRCWVLDARGRPVPPGVPGELYLGGSGVARGYIGTLKTPDAFSANPYQDGATRMYRTGDIVKWRRDGELDYIGRNDFRVKLRGLLVELGEIEHVLMSHPGVRHASALVVDVGAASSVGRQIVGCVIADGFDEPAVLAGAKARLPDYMVPWRLMLFDAFPSNSSGKVDRKALTERVLARIEQDADARRPADAAEALSPEQAALCTLWKTQLDLASIGTRENFFQLGGDSLSLTRMVLAAERELALKIDFSRFLTNPTIDGFLAACAHRPDGATTTNDAVNRQEDAPYAADLAAVATLPAFTGTTAKAADAYLLTGATGHLGAWLLRMLLEETHADVYVLVRGNDDADARARLDARYRAMFGGALPVARVRICRGDATVPRFGMDDDSHARLLTHVTQVVHCAAHVNHAADYAFMREGNVGASRHVLAFASAAKVAHVHYISTQYTELGSLPEQWLDHAAIRALSSGYERSKFVAEACFAQSVLHGYPTSIYRLPLLIDDRDPNLKRQNHFVAFSNKCVAMGAYPDLPVAVPVMPTEHVARYIVRRSKVTMMSAVRNVHIDDLDFRAIVARLRNGSTLRGIPAAEWVARARDETPESDPFFRMLPLYSALGDGVGCGRPVEHAAYLDELGRLEMPAADDSGNWLLDTTAACLDRLAAL